MENLCRVSCPTEIFLFHSLQKSNTMPRYSLNFDLHNAETGDYERLKDVLNTKCNNVVDRRVESTFEFDSDCENPVSMKNELERWLARFDMTFTVIDLDNGGRAEGETTVAHCNRLANYSPGK